MEWIHILLLYTFVRFLSSCFNLYLKWNHHLTANDPSYFAKSLKSFFMEFNDIILKYGVCWYAGGFDFLHEFTVSHFGLETFAQFVAFKFLFDCIDMTMCLTQKKLINIKFNINSAMDVQINPGVMDNIFIFPLITIIATLMLSTMKMCFLFVLPMEHAWIGMIGFDFVCEYIESAASSFLSSSPHCNTITPIHMCLVIYHQRQRNLETEIRNLAQKHQFPLSDIFIVFDAKKPFDHPFIQSHGKQNKIFLSSKLLEDLSTDEILALVARKIGDWKLGAFTFENVFHVLSIVLYWYLVHTMTFYYFEWLCIDVFGMRNASRVVGNALSMMMCDPLWTIVDIVKKYLWRQQLFYADKFSVQNTSSEVHLISALKKVHATDHEEHPMSIILSYHGLPNLSDRINHIESVVTKTK